MLYSANSYFGIDTKPITAAIVIIEIGIAFTQTSYRLLISVVPVLLFESGALLQVHLYKYSYQKCKCTKC